ncbi:MAG TPA: hypothetical protein VH019_04540 [Rhizomicrobium sp.]|jgi:hypothetical protein|nr:hypothetical protein [Rhizomicrobium sp.]
MNLWQKLTIDWPCALGDWLWANLVVAPATFLDWLTVRRGARIILQIVVFIALLIYFEQIASLDLTFLFYIDANIYLDIFVAIFFLVARGQMPQMAQAATQKIRQSLQDCSKMLLRFGARRRRNANAMRRKSGTDGSKQPDDERAARSGAGYAFA